MQRAPDHLVVHRAQRPSDPAASAASRARFLRIALVQQRERAAAQRQPGVRGGIGLPVEQAMGPLQPAVRRRLRSPRNAAVSQASQTATRAAPMLSPRSRQAIGALAHVEQDVGEIQPPRRDAQPFERFGRFFQSCSEASNAARAPCQSPRSSAPPGPSSRFTAEILSSKTRADLASGDRYL